MTTYRNLLSFSAAARAIEPNGVTRQAVAERVSSGKIVPVVVGGRRFVRQRDVERWNRERRKQHTTP